MNLAVAAYTGRTIFVPRQSPWTGLGANSRIRPEYLRPYIPESRSGGELQCPLLPSSQRDVDSLRHINICGFCDCSPICISTFFMTAPFFDFF